MYSITKISVFFLACVVLTGRIAPESGVREFYDNERSALIQLRDSLSSTTNLHSNWTGPPCFNDLSRWIGITCSSSHVVGISLEGVQLTGSLPPTALQGLSYLRNLSLSNNALHGGLPNLRGLTQMQVISLSRNRFSGSIPIEFAALPILSQLQLQDNLLNGTIPAFDQQTLAVFDVSFNFLEGKIPDTSVLRRFPRSSFDHNLELCGKPLDKTCPEAPRLPAFETPPPGPTGGASPPPPAASSPSHDRKLRLWVTTLLAVAAVVVLFLLILCFLYYCKKHQKTTTTSTEQDGLGERKEWDGSGRMSGQELEFFDNERWSFNINDLLRSSAEVLGKGTLGTTYKTTLDSGTIVAVKRLRMVDELSRKELVQQMRLLGGLRHDNLAEIISYYYSKDEKLVIYEHVPGGSLFQLLHDNRGEGRVPLNWAARLQIVEGIARGLGYLHQSLPSHKAPHANLKSSNVLIHHNNYQLSYTTKLIDYGFQPFLCSPNHAKRLAIGNTPEFSRGKKLTQKADVFCFGLVLTEVITGNVPSKDEEDLSVWVRSMVGDWSMEVLDLEIVAERERHGEMKKLAQLALECVALEPERRPTMSEAVKTIEEI